MYDPFIDGKTGCDGFDLVNCRNVLIEDSRIEGSNDGLCFKTQAGQGLGPWLAANITVRRCYVSSECCDTIQFGSRTEVDIKNFSFSDMVLGSGKKPAISLVSMDSANISNVYFRTSVSKARISLPLSF